MGRKAAEEVGHNQPINVKKMQDHVMAAAQIMDKMDALNEKLKAHLRSAKDDGLLKTAVRKAAKALRLTSEQRQAQLEIRDATDTYIHECEDLPLFSNRHGNTDEEAAA